MLGRFSHNMTVRIPAVFQDSNKNPVDMENVNVGIQYFDKDHRDLKNILQETPMKQTGTGKYVYEFTVPKSAQPGNYVVHIQAKYPGSISNVSEATDTFEVIENKQIVENQVKEEVLEPVEQEESQPEKPSFDVNTFKIDKVRGINANSKIEIEDVVVDVYNNPVKGVHVNVYEKFSFMPKSPNNVKVASAITDENGVWKMNISQGEYVFTYKGLGLKEMREFRKV